MLKVAIVILNWNGEDYLRRFLPGLVQTTKVKGVKVYIADNASTDHSLELLEKEFPETEIIKLDKNYGFAEGYNRALSQIESEYFLLVNSDVQVTTNWLLPLINTLESDPLVAACSPKIKSYDQPHFFEYAGAAGGFIDKYGYAFCQGRIFDSVETDYGQYDKGREIFWTTGACMLIRGPLFKIVGGFDPDFFAHFEEIDLCWRLKNRGYKFKIVPESTVFHIGGGTLPPSNPWKTYLNFRNNLMCLYKNLPDEKLGNTILTRLLMDGLSVFRFLKSGKFRDISAILRAHIAFYKSLKKLRKFRAEERRFINNFEHKEIYPGSIVREFFLKKKYTFLSLKWFYT
ncbi:MAG: glycosyltransferase family 2 protein [Bacteroidales bacterium]